MMGLKERVKAWLGPVWWYAAVMFAVQRFGDVINLYTGLWLVPKWVPQEELGALLPLTQIGAMLGLPLAIILTPFTKYINTFGAKGEYGKVKALLSDAFLLTGLSAGLIGAYTWVTAPHVFQRLRIEQAHLVWLLSLLAVVSLFLPILNSALQALKLFRCMSVIGLAAAPARLLVLIVLLPLSGLLGYFSAQVMLYAVSIGIGLWGLRMVFAEGIRRESYFGHLKEMCLYTLPVAAMIAVGNISTTVQYFVIRQRLPDVESAAFYFASRFSEIPNMLWTAIAIAFFPLVSEAFEKGKNTSRLFLQSLALTVVGGGLVAIALGFGMGYVFRWVSLWREYQPYAYLILWMSLSNVFRVSFACFTTYETACRRFRFIAYSVPLSLLESAILLVLTGYGLFEPYLPKACIEWMASLRAARLNFIVGVMFASAVIQFACIFVQLWLRNARAPKPAGGAPA